MERDLRVEIRGPEAAPVVRRMVGSSMGRLHAYYASYPVEVGVAEAALLLASGKPVGVEVFYSVGGICVHYYVVVDRRYRGRGLGKVLVASVEEYCGGKAYVATTQSWNRVSMAMFESMCYRLYDWEELESLLGSDRAYALLMASCGYEDDVVMVKTVSGGLASIIDSTPWNTIERVWERVCYEPWARLAYR